MTFAQYVTNVAADTTLVTTAETVLATLSGISSQRVGQQVVIEGDFVLLTGTNTTAVAVRIREDSLTGNVVDELETDTAVGAAGSTDPYRITAVHSPTGELSTKTYVMTASQTGASANGTCVHATLKASLQPS